MFKVGDAVIHPAEGVCRVTEIVRVKPKIRAALNEILSTDTLIINYSLFVIHYSFDCR